MSKRISYELALAIVNNIIGLNVIDQDEKILFIESGFAQNLGTTQDDAIGKPVSDVILNAGLPRVLHTKQEEWGKVVQPIGVTGRVASPTICNRLPLYANGDRDPKNIIGAMSYSSIKRGYNMELVMKELQQLREQNDLLWSQITDNYKIHYVKDDILGESPEIQEMKEMIYRVADTTATVCILGETGTGKELVANAIHRGSPRNNKPFVKINCAAIPKDLMESELFGYEPGAFTGASRQGKMGKFELANGGTLLLDEIGELPLALQAKLLRVLQSNEVERVGGSAPIPIDVRIICSTNQNLSRMVSEGQFRADLYYRINVIEVHIPPLRERKEDIHILISSFIDQMNKKYKLSIAGIAETVLPMLKEYHWPGNVRELQHLIERACILRGSGFLQNGDFSFPAMEIVESKKENSFKEYLANTEKERILNALEASNGNKTEAANLLNMPRMTLYRKLKKYGIEC